jgi:polysaccharide deacetylase family protein (PEP-CTERM system associated)
VQNAFSIDVEDYFQVSAFAGAIDRRQWDHYECRVVPNTQRLLALLEREQVRGTFFVLGWVARKFPGLVRDIDRGGHEIGCHSFWHRLIYELSPEEFREDLRLGRDVLEQILGRSVTAFRAPSFSIVERSLWALEILADEGFRDDSSIFPVRHDRYGIPGAAAHPFAIDTAAGRLREFPPAVCRVLGCNLPVAGGGYFRLFPWAFSRRGLQAINHTAGRPFVFYLHPWEIDPAQPRLPGSWKSRFRHYINLESTERKLLRLLQTFRFGTLSEVLDQQPQPPIVSIADLRQRRGRREPVSEPRRSVWLPRRARQRV